MTQIRPARTGASRGRPGGTTAPGITVRRAEQAASRPAPGWRWADALGTMVLVLVIVAVVSLTTALLITSLAVSLMSVGPPDPTGLERSSTAQPWFVGSRTDANQASA